MNSKKIISTTLLVGAFGSIFGQGMSAVEFFDSTGTNSAAKFGWTGSVESGNFYVETPNDGNGFSLQNGNMTLDGSITASSFTGDGSGLTGINATGATATEVATELKGDAGFMAEVEGPQGEQGIQGPKGDTGGAGTTDWAGITGKPTTFTPANHSASTITSGTLSASRLPSSVVQYTDLSGYKNIGNNFYISNTQDDYNGLYARSFGDNSTAALFQLYSGSTQLASASIAKVDNGNIYAGFFTGNVHIDGDINVTGACTGCSSDRRLKKEITPIDSALTKLLKINGVEYKWKREEFPQRKFSEKNQLGVIAQEIEKVLPELVGTDSKGYLFVEYQKIVPVLIEAIKEQQTMIDSLKSESQTSKEQIVALNQKVDTILKMVSSK